MPATSKAQAVAAGQALAAKKGEIPQSSLGGSALRMFKSMSELKLTEFAATDQTKLPEKVRQKEKTGRKNRPKRKRRMR